ncbi:MAG: glycosyltransferase, partial [Steroidobacteraceae bacterium]
MLTSRSPVDLTALIPVGGRYASDPAALWREYAAALAALGLTFEGILILDGPHPDIAAALERLVERDERVTVLELTRSFGEATALMAGFQRSRGRILLTLPAYPQIEPSDVGKLVSALESADMACGHRWPRAGTLWERVRRGMFHAVLARVTQLHFRDLGCCARALRRQVLEEIPLYGDQHRFLPILADRQGFKVAEVTVRQSPRDRRDGSYPARVYVRRALDIFTVFFLTRFTKKPLRFFGMIGAGTFGAGVLITAWLVVERLVLGHALADRPALLLSSLLVVLGLQLLAIGLLGELIIFTHAGGAKDYKVDRIIHDPDGAPGLEDRVQEG